MTGSQVAKEINHSGLKMSGWKAAMRGLSQGPLTYKQCHQPKDRKCLSQVLQLLEERALEPRSFDSQSSALSTTHTVILKDLGCGF